MAEFISSFITGFQDVVAQDLPLRLSGIKILNVFDGLIHYQYSGDSHNLEKIIYFNNTFFVLKTFKGKSINFASMVNSIATEKKYYLINKGSFRVRFQNENQFSKVDKNISKKSEEIVLNNSKLKLDRLSPSTEIWYSIRREDFGFCGQLISKREFTEKNLNKGELRPEIAYLICCYANIKNNDIIAEPFCGYGSIPVQIAKKFDFEKLYVSDLSLEKVSLVKEKKQIKDNSKIQVCMCDALELKHIQDKTCSLVITDPPWGYYEQIDDIFKFYEQMFLSLKRILKDDGKIIILSARTEELENVVKKIGMKIEDYLHTLVNGKKARIYKITN